MKVYQIPSISLHLRHGMPPLAIILAMVLPDAAMAEIWTVGSASNGTWSTAANWQDGTAGTPAPPGVAGGSYSNVRININGIITYTGAEGTQTYDVSGTGGETRAFGVGIGGTGQLTMTGGEIILVQEGTNEVAVMGNSSTSVATLNLSGGKLTLNETDTNGDATFVMAFVTGATGTVNIDNGGVLTADRVSRGSGNGTLNLNAGGSLVVRSIIGGTLNFDGGTVQIRNSTSTLMASTILSANILGGGLTIDTNGFNGSIGKSLVAGATGTGGLTKTGAGTLTLNVANTYVGTTLIQAGTLAYGTSDAIAGGAVTVDGSTAVLSLGANRTDTVGTVTLAGGGGITGTGTSTLTSTGTFEMKSGAASVILAGSGIALNKTTGGTMTLSGANTYTGATTVSAGTLLINGNQSASTGAVTVASGATLGGIGTIGGSTVINGIHAVGNGGIGQQKFSSGLTYGSGSTFSWELGSQTTSGPGTNFDSVVVGGNLNVQGGVFNVIVTNLNLGASFWDANRTWSIFEAGATTGTFSSFNLYNASNLASAVNYSSRGIFSFSGGQLSWSAVPEPTNALAGMLVVAGLMRRRRTSP